MGSFLVVLLGLDLALIGTVGFLFGPTAKARIATVALHIISGIAAACMLSPEQREAGHFIVLVSFQALMALLGWCSTQQAESFFAPPGPRRRKQRYPRY